MPALIVAASYNGKNPKITLLRAAVIRANNYVF